MRARSLRRGGDIAGLAVEPEPFHFRTVANQLLRSSGLDRLIALCKPPLQDEPGADRTRRPVLPKIFVASTLLNIAIEARSTGTNRIGSFARNAIVRDGIHKAHN